jgi:hypothetical protein
LGVVFIALGALFLFFPTTLSPPTHVSSRTFLLRVSPDGYSNFNQSLGPQQTLTGTMISTPHPVDFFLMNTGNYSTWNSRGHPPSEVYPQSSKSNATNYSFTMGVSNVAMSYTMVFISRSPTSSTSVQLTVVVDSSQSLLQANTPTIILFVCGLALVVFGATRRGKKPEPPPAQKEEEPSGGGGFLGGLFGGTSSSTEESQMPAGKRCRYCGAQLEQSANFCPSCRMSQL